MTVDFTDRVVVITGAGGGLGREYALEIARRGGAVVVNDLGGNVDGLAGSRSMADRVVDEIRAGGGRAIANYDSVASREGGERLAQASIDAFGRIDALINNAGNLRNAAFGDLEEADRDAVWAVHLAGAFNVTQPIYRHMKERGYGRILFTASGAGLFGNPNQTAYGAAKAGIVGLTNVLALEGRPYGVLCNALLPVAASRMQEKMDPAEGVTMSSYARHFAKAMLPGHVMPLAVYLASEANTATHELYSALGGRYARVFIGIAPGWTAPDLAQPSVDDIAGNIAEIRTIDGFSIPESLTDEFRILAEQLQSGTA